MTTTPLQLLTRLRQLGLKASNESGALRIRGPLDKLAPELKGQLLRHKAALLEVLAQAQAGEPRPRIPAAPRDAPLPLSHQQLRLWFIQQHMPGMETAYNMAGGLRLRGPLSLPALHAAFQALLDRHENLRTRFVWPSSGGEPVQEVLPSLTMELPLAECAEADLTPAAQAFAQHVFRLDAGPMLRATVLRLAPDHHVLLMGMHHIVYDGWSLGLMEQELQTLYAAAVAGQPAVLAPLDIQYADYAHWQRRQDLSQHLAYWMSALAGHAEGLPLPYDRAPTATASPARFASHRYPPGLASSLAQLCQREQATLFMGLLAGLAVVLGRHSGLADLCVGTTVAGRDILQLEPLIGFFVNILPLRLDLSGSPTTLALLRRVRETTLGAYEHQALPFEQMRAALQRERGGTLGELVPVMARHQNFPDPSGASWGPGLQASPLPNEGLAMPAKCELDFQFTGSGEDLGVTVEYAAGLFDEATVRRLLEHHEQVLRQMVDNPGRPVASLKVLTGAERASMAQWQGAETPLPAEGIAALFERQAAASPDAVACFDDAGRLTYAELNARANRLAHALVRRGLAPQDRVGLCLPRCTGLLVGLLAIFKAGGAYVPLDPRLPAAYLARMLHDARPACVVTEPGLHGLLPPALPCLDVGDGAWASLPDSNPGLPSRPRQLACVMYTSGSTGTPKGVMVPQVQVLNLLHALWRRAPFHPGEVMSSKTSIGFAVSVKELLGGLLVGCPVVMIPPETAQDARAFVRALTRHRVSRLHLVPSHLQVMLEAMAPGELGALRHCVTAGEPLPRALRDTVQRKLPQVTLWNNYGCTELNDVSYSTPEDDPGDCDFVPLGRPIANTRVHILDAQLNQVPLGAAGEICVDGIGTALGYWKQPSLTAARFVPNPFGQPGSRLYRTGDMARWRADGSIEYLGRRDFEVKIRGHRIDVRQVEATLSAHSGVARAAVQAWRPKDAVAQLVAYCVPVDGHRIDGTALREHLAQRLPSYMVPSLYVALDAMPALPNGKLDRLSLPAPDRAELATTGYEAPATDIESAMASIWSELLHVPADRIGRHDNFFALGGHSLLGSLLVTRIGRELGPALAVSEVFAHPTVAALAALAVRRRAAQASSSLVPLNVRPGAPTLFCVHTVDGDAVHYAALAQALGPRRSVYGLQSVQPAEDLTLESLARRHADEILTVQPQGPYSLAAWSAGARFAAAVAAQLRRQDAEVASITLLDPVVESIPESRREATAGLIVLRAMAQAPVPQAAMAAFEGRDGFVQALRQRQPWIVQALREWLPGCTDATFDALARMAQATARHLAVLEQFTPVPLPCPLHVLWGESSEWKGRIPDWSALGVEAARVHERAVPGDHHTMLRAPQADVLAAAVAAVHAGAQA